MAWLFGKKDTSEKDDEWIIKKGQKNSLQLFVRIRQSKPKGIKTQNYPHLLGISWDYEPRDDSGLPNSSDLNRMRVLEELLDRIETKSVAYLMVIITGDNTREWLWYTRNPQDMMAQVNQALKGQEPFPIKFIREDDPNWSAYEHWLAA